VKNRLSRPALALLSLALTVSFAFGQQPAPQRRGEARPAPNAPNTPRAARERARTAPNATSALEEDFAEALSIVQDNYVDGVKLDYNTVFKSSIIGMLRSLDPHSNYYDAKEFEELQTDWRSEYFGVGASIINHDVNGETSTFVLATFENSPASKAGLRYGDKIIAVDGKDAKGKSSAEVRDWIRGPKGSTVKMSLERAATGAKETVEITRDVVPQPTVPDAYMIKPGVGYIDMQHGFNRTTADEFVERLEQLHKQGMTQLVVDLRNNPGGLLDQAVKVAERFLGRGQLILSQRGRIEGADRTYNSTNSNPDSIPLVVLVNRNTASASEIVAGALQDHGRAFIVGETSFGKGLVQHVFTLPYGYGLTLTTQKYYTPYGRSIQRDYSAGSLYDYYVRHDADDEPAPAAPRSPTLPAAPNPNAPFAQPTPQPAPKSAPAGPAVRTAAGRVFYGGGGITPDAEVKPLDVASPARVKIFEAAFHFTRQLAAGQIAGLENYRVEKVLYGQHPRPTDLPVTDRVLEAFKEFVHKDEETYGLTPAQLDAEADYARLRVRDEIATAAYGNEGGLRTLLDSDPQLLRALEALPDARRLAEMVRASSTS
jgi:carboxyl-terminal processing protease